MKYVVKLLLISHDHKTSRSKVHHHELVRSTFIYRKHIVKNVYETNKLEYIS